MFDTTLLDRRQMLGGAVALSALALPHTTLAATGRPDWFVGVDDVAADIPQQTLTRLHGRVPDGLDGTLYRNGPARFRRGGSASGHWFDGDGLIRAWSIRGGVATLTARFVDTPSGGSRSGPGRLFSRASGPLHAPGAMSPVPTIPTRPTRQ